MVRVFSPILLRRDISLGFQMDNRKVPAVQSRLNQYGNLSRNEIVLGALVAPIGSLMVFLKWCRQS